MDQPGSAPPVAAIGPGGFTGCRWMSLTVPVPRRHDFAWRHGSAKNGSVSRLPRTSRLLLTLFLMALPGQALAAPRNDLSDELGFAIGRATPHSPRTGQLMDTLSAGIDAGAGWSVLLSAGLTVLEATSGVAGQQYASRGATTLYFSPGVAWEASDHLAFGLALTWSPSSRLLTDTTLTYANASGRTVDADALLSATTSSSGAHLSASWETEGDSDFETAVDLDAGVTRYAAEQHVLAVRDPASGASVSDQQLRAWCDTHPCSRQLLGLLRERATPLVQSELRLGVTETIREDTDVGIGASYFLYDRDPTEVGFYGLVAAGRGPGFASGMPLAPLRWSVRPEVAHRFGDFGVRLWLEHGLYVDDEGTSNALGVKLQYRFAKSFRMWVTASLRRDTDALGNESTFDQAMLGAAWLF